MTVVPLGTPDAPEATSRRRGGVSEDDGAGGFAEALARAVGSTSAALEGADAAERAFAAGRGGLAEMTLERARADVALAVASATASHVAQALQTILGMAV